MKPSRFVVVLGVVLLTGAAVSGAACWRLMGAGSFDLDPACAGPSFSLTNALVPAFDYAELRDTTGEGRVLETAGVKCARAKDVAACEAKLAATTSTDGWSNGSNGRLPGHHYIVATRGDDVVLVTDDNAADAVKPIDTATKAAFVSAVRRNIFPKCARSVRQKGGVFEVHLESSSCFGPVDEVVSIDAAGALQVVESVQGPATCVGTLTPLSKGIARRE